MEWLSVGFGLLLGLALGILFARIYWRQTEVVPASVHGELQRSEAAALERVRSLESERARLDETVGATRQETVELERALSAVQARMPLLEERMAKLQSERDLLKDAAARAAALESEKKLLEQQLKAQREYLEEVKKQTRSEFENLANEVLKARAKDFNEQTEKSLDTILKPLKEKLQTFEKKVDDSYTNEAKERHALKSEIERLIGLNDRMTRETQALTQALRGDSKTQGDWGELVLEKILESSGLTEGREYSQQKSHENDDGERMRPDIVINLPENKHVIVDSKVSLTAYELYRRTPEDSEQPRAQALAAHIKSLEKHIDDLGSKHYAKLKGVNSPELVFLFVPVEPAYLLAMQTEPDLSSRAWRKGIAIVTATTLLTSLKTVASIWKVENRNKNALEIASEGAKLYDKFVGFLEDFERIGKTFDSGKAQYDSAMGKLKEGPGNVFRRMEYLRELGAAPAKRIRAELTE
jgi:DNA recombination protein RmuC